MASQHRKHRGYESQKIVAEYLRTRGWPYAEPTGAGRQGSDVIGVLDLDVEVKARAGFDPLAAMRQQDERGTGRFPFAVLRMNGQGEASIGAWPCVIRFDNLIDLLRQAGYGDNNNTEKETP
jgi:hypothetical protein